MSHCGYFATTLILLTSGLLSIGFPMERKTCFNVSNRHICYFQPQENHLTNNRITWYAAWNICQINSATLPIIENEEVQKTFEEYLGNISLNTNETWLGGRQEVIKKEWQWYNKKPFYQPDLIWYGDDYLRTQSLILRIPDPESPSNVKIKYLAWYPSGSRYYICQYSASRCPADNSAIQNEHHGCLKVIKRELNASEATKDCNKTGGRLAIFDGDEFLTKAPEVYQQNLRPATWYIIGLHRIDTKPWLWMRSNNKNSTMEGNYDNWSDRNNRADGGCLFATANDHKWEASSCYAGKRFICQTMEILATTTTTTTTTTKEDADKMNDQPLVTTRIASTSRKSTTATTAENSLPTTVTTAATISQHSDVSATPGISATKTTVGNSPNTTGRLTDCINNHNEVSSVTVGLVLGIGEVQLFVIIIILIIIILKLKKKPRKMPVGKVENAVEAQQYQELQRIETYASASNDYAESRLSTK